MDTIMYIASRENITVVEDAAQGVGSYYKGRALGSIGHLSAYSFHETKNYICGEGGALCINQPEYVERAEIIRDKGTNRQKFIRGQVDKYTWVDVGSSYVPSEISSAFLWAQLEQLDTILERRKDIFNRYREHLSILEEKGLAKLPYVPDNCTTNYHLFYLILLQQKDRDGLIDYLRQNDVLSVFHYIPLHSSPVGQRFGYTKGDLIITEEVSSCLLRLPFYYELTVEDQMQVIDLIVRFFHK